MNRRNWKLLSEFPEVVAQWHPTKNEEVTPADTWLASSQRAAWWKCDVADDHEWQTSIATRTIRGLGCPYCGGRRASVTNSLASLFPEVAAQWHPSKNGRRTPASIHAHGETVVW